MLIQLTRTADSPVKPREGEPCNGCGYCCAGQLCNVGLLTFKTGVTGGAPCPALEWDGERFRCGMMLHPVRYINPKLAEDPESRHLDESLGRGFRKMLGEGKGCTCYDADEAEAHVCGGEPRPPVVKVCTADEVGY